jgi:peptidoglycan hydrolase-like protein with peptidoglycan-binding domain
VRDFQQKNRLKADGVAGKATLEKLDSQLRDPVAPLPPLPSPAPQLVQGVPLIPQDKTMACWYASAQMVIQWRRSRLQMTETNYRDPREVPWAVQTYRGNNGLLWQDMVRYAMMLGLKSVPQMTPSPQALSDWLSKYGPIWAAGQKVTSTNRYGHVFVITGFREDQLYIHDPEPVNEGSRRWVGFDWLVSLLEWGADRTIETNFLHFPG